MQSGSAARTVIPRFAGKRVADDEIVAGHVREAPEIQNIVEALVTCLKALVAAGRDDKAVTG